MTASQHRQKPRVKRFLRALVQLALLSANVLLFYKASEAAPAPPGNIDNTATGSFTDTVTNITTQIQSNTVTLTVVEVAGITVQSSAVTEAPTTVTGAGAYQSIAGINTNDIVYFDFTLTNVGNDPTQFFIPDAPSSLSGATFNKATNPIQIIAVDPDGASGATPEKVLATPVNVTNNGGDNTINLLGTPDGYIPPSGTVKVRVPVKVTATTVGSSITATLGNTTGATGTQNQPYTNNGNDLYTVDLANGTGVPSGAGYTNTTPETNGAPANGVVEASDVGSIPLVETPVVQGFKAVKLTNDADATGSVTSGDQLTWSIIYKNTSGVNIPNFQIADLLDTNTTLVANTALFMTISYSSSNG